MHFHCIIECWQIWASLVDIRDQSVRHSLAISLPMFVVLRRAALVVSEAPVCQQEGKEHDIEPHQRVIACWQSPEHSCQYFWHVVKMPGDTPPSYSQKSALCCKIWSFRWCFFLTLLWNKTDVHQAYAEVISFLLFTVDILRPII